jgi:hypothetical protein
MESWLERQKFNDDWNIQYLLNDSADKVCQRIMKQFSIERIYQDLLQEAA